LKSCSVLVLPGWLNSGPDHWQSRWQATHGYTRVEQHDWARPLRGDWIARLEEVVLAQDADVPITLVAHSLGCLLIAAWAGLSHNTHRVKCAFLVAPCDIALEVLRPVLPSWKPLSPQKLPFRSALLASRDDPYCSFEQAQTLAANWGSSLIDCGARGHLNAESGLSDWPQGHALLLALQRSAPAGELENPNTTSESD
jgi:uncharacterized protein